MSGPLKQQRGVPAYIDKRENTAREERESEQHRENIAAINAVANQLATDEKEQDSNDKKRRFREWLTILLLFTTVVAAATGDVIFYRTMEDARTATEENTRAWAGPSGASIDGTVSVGQPVTIKVAVTNTGREPARNFIWTLNPIVASADDISTIPDGGWLDQQIQRYVKQCQGSPSKLGSQVLFPSSGFGGGFQFSQSFPTGTVTKEVTDGTYVLVTEGCLIYDTAKKTRHSTFCYYYKGNATKPDNLNLCQAGNTAD